MQVDPCSHLYRKCPYLADILLFSKEPILTILGDISVSDLIVCVLQGELSLVQVFLSYSLANDIKCNFDLTGTS